MWRTWQTLLLEFWASFPAFRQVNYDTSFHVSVKTSMLPPCRCQAEGWWNKTAFVSLKKKLQKTYFVWDLYEPVFVTAASNCLLAVIEELFELLIYMWIAYNTLWLCLYLCLNETSCGIMKRDTIDWLLKCLWSVGCRIFLSLVLFVLWQFLKLSDVGGVCFLGFCIFETRQIQRSRDSIQRCP